MTDALVARLDDAIRSQLEPLRVPGCAIALIENHALAEVRVYGVADRETGAPVTAETVFSLQSISKSFAAWAVMTLVEAGRVDLDTPVSRYLKRWSLPPSDVYDLDLVTPRRLLSHHAGVTVRGFRGVEPWAPRHTVVDALRGSLPPPNEEQVRYYADWNLEPDEPVWIAHRPGEAWRYSNAGFAILEVMIEDVTGEDYAALVARDVLAPLGLANAGFDPLDRQNRARPYSKQGERCVEYRWPCRAAAGVYASITDLAGFACAEMAGPTGEPAGRGVVSADAVQTMFTPHGLADNAGGVQFEAGLGHLLVTSGGPLNVHHSGGSIGWRSIFSIFPQTGDGICMLMNGDGANDLWVPLVRQWRAERRA
ncbi:MAG TPA: serine hydrolase domain-containing protein [Caulobacteraceae bacterium]|nr:serine hydrolase domain-containing protein [Caulobacteraceae bacterium]